VAGLDLLYTPTKSSLTRKLISGRNIYCRMRQTTKWKSPTSCRAFRIHNLRYNSCRTLHPCSLIYCFYYPEHPALYVFILVNRGCADYGEISWITVSLYRQKHLTTFRFTTWQWCSTWSIAVSIASRHLGQMHSSTARPYLAVYSGSTFYDDLTKSIRS
jgi:hypothetical protein